ncbi:glycerophosphodiester phosphodiesterase family protein [Rubrimonas cliftonensis]|uniref:Glycerophosphoryl diester phosphodiesterase n=1 Tax=Rubrimonas cliftonensis TaxID=89524 RepID=A0A1H4CD55_9RHOB|nr:glycerophosphodiester phosphodiesterase family protein [Rubrimonas cliftonensis]SEA58250.1 glycerophosphoryl diester phosphodiesterase [Rubrimonas cliftonensis]
MTEALAAYALAWRRRAFVIPLFMGVRLLSLAVVAPLTGAVVALAVSLSRQPALSDADILMFLATPGGVLAALGLSAVFLVGSVVGLAAMTIDLRRPDASGLRAIPAAVMRLGGRLRALAHYAALLTLRVLALAAPFVLAALLTARALISERDINYYLSERPPEFLLAAAVIALLALGLAALLAARFAGWAVSLHLALFEAVPPARAFGLSRERIAGGRRRLLRALGWWLAIRLGLSMAGAAAAALAMAWAPGLLEGHVRLALLTIGVLAALWALLDMAIAGVALGALAALLNARFDPDATEAPVGAPPPRRVRVVVAAAALAAVTGPLAGAAMLDGVEASDAVLVIGHRGASALAPENSLAAIRRAVEDGADWVEIDVQESAEGAVIVVHDSDFMKLAGVGLKVRDATADDLARIDIGSWFGPEHAGERTPTLAQALEAVRGRARLLIELKHYGFEVDLENRVAAVVEAAGMADEVAVMSLKYASVVKMAALRPGWPLGVLAATAIGDVSRLEGDFVAIRAASASPGLAERLHRAGKKLIVWTVNDPAEMSAMISLGADGLITDDPGLARDVLAARAAMTPPERLLVLLADRLGLDLPASARRDDSP